MEHMAKTQNHKLDKRRLFIIGGIVGLLLCVVIGFFLIQPQRTVANFCNAAQRQKDNFKRSTGYDKLLSSFRKLDDVAPDAIHSDTSLIVKGYESIVDDPSNAVSSELGISNSQMRVNDYITQNCPNY